MYGVYLAFLFIETIVVTTCDRMDGRLHNKLDVTYLRKTIKRVSITSCDQVNNNKRRHTTFVRRILSSRQMTSAHLEADRG